MITERPYCGHAGRVIAAVSSATITAIPGGTCMLSWALRYHLYGTASVRSSKVQMTSDSPGCTLEEKLMLLY